MDPILRVIHYLFKKKNIVNNSSTVISFFDDGISFPKFVALAFYIDDIPFINKNPKTGFHKEINNNVALSYLFEHNKLISKMSPNFNTEHDMVNLLSLILTKQIFPLNLQLIIIKCKLIIKPSENNEITPKYLLSVNCLLSLLNVLMDGKVPINDKITDFDLLMEESFKLANAPLVIDKTSLEDQNQLIFLIQYEILFDFYEEKINQIMLKIFATGNLEEKKEIEKLKEMEKQKEISKQKEIERRKKIEKENPIDIEYQKELEQNEIEIRQKIEDQIRQKIEDQIKQKNLEEIENKKLSEKSLVNDIGLFKDVDNIDDENEDDENSTDLEKDMNEEKKVEFLEIDDEESTDSEKDSNEDLNEIFDSVGSIIKEDEKKRRKSNLIPTEYKNSELEEFNFLSTFKTKKSDEFNPNSSDDDMEDIENIEVLYINEEDKSDKSSESIEESQIQNKNKKAQNDKKSNKKEKQKKGLNTFDIKLLDVIKKIDNKEYKNFKQAIENDGIPKFVMHVLNLNSIKNVIITETNNKKQNNLKEQDHLTESQLKNIEEVIKYLQEKEPNFKILLFDFKNRAYLESSAILFYQSFINFFFLKPTKKQLFQRVTTLLYKKLPENDINNEIKILTNWKTYASLCYFVDRRKLDFNYNSIDFDVAKCLNNYKIPLIIDKEFLNQCKELTELPISIYCQIKFIFDRIDDLSSKGYSYNVVETFLQVIKMFSNNIPKSGVLASSIRAKNMSLILQKNEYNNYLIQKQLNELRSSPNDEIMDLEYEKKIQNPPLPFNETRKGKKIANSVEILIKSLEEEKANSYEYWNHPDQPYSFDKGILYPAKDFEKFQKFYQQKWISEMLVIQKNVQLKSERRIPQDHHQKTAKLYKIFLYNIQTNKWEYDSKSFKSLTRNIKDDEKTPLVLFLNSDEEDLAKLAYNSKIVSGNYPILDDNIFVYGFCNNQNQSIKPIFLFLHLPVTKSSLPNISTIVYSIYIFLCFICDIEIIVLNKDYYSDQIDFIKKVNDIKNSFKEKSYNSNKSKSELHLFSSDDDDDKSDDDVDICEEEDLIEFIKQNTNVNFTHKLFQKKRKIIALFNDDNNFDSKQMTENFVKNTFFDSMNSSISHHLSTGLYINVNDSESYKAFNHKLNELCTDTNITTKYEDVLINFKNVQFLNLSFFYVSLKLCVNWRENLKKGIEARFSSLIQKYDKNIHHLTILDYVKKEILSTVPSIDLDITNECNKILFDIMNRECREFETYLTNEIERISKSNMKYLNSIINYEKFWDENKKENLKNSHISFLKNYFFNIIKTAIHPGDVVRFVYNQSKSILNHQIKNDMDSIEELVNLTKPNNQIQKRHQNSNIDEVKNKSRKGTNYTIRETEFTREILVTVDIENDLKSEIAQDF